MRRILIFEIFKRMQTSQQCSFNALQWLRISGVFLFDCREAARLYRSSGEVAQMRQ